MVASKFEKKNLNWKLFPEILNYKNQKSVPSFDEGNLFRCGEKKVTNLVYTPSLPSETLS